MLYGVLILPDQLVVLVEHLSVIGAALLELALVAEPGVIIATFCCLV